MNNAGATNKVSWISRTDEWAAFDRLPSAIRGALNQSLGKWSAYQILRLIEERTRTVDEILAQLPAREQKIWDTYKQETGQTGHDIPIPNTYRDNPRPRSPHRRRGLRCRDRCGRLWSAPVAAQH